MAYKEKYPSKLLEEAVDEGFLLALGKLVCAVLLKSFGSLGGA